MNVSHAMSCTPSCVSKQPPIQSLKFATWHFQLFAISVVPGMLCHLLRPLSSYFIPTKAEIYLVGSRFLTTDLLRNISCLFLDFLFICMFIFCENVTGITLSQDCISVKRTPSICQMYNIHYDKTK